MSDDQSPSLERSTLERKDRAELATIADMLGQKPPSRAKKSEIIDLILDLTGVVEGTPASNGGGSSGDEAAEQPPAADAGEPTPEPRAEPTPEQSEPAAEDAEVATEPADVAPASADVAPAPEDDGDGDEPKSSSSDGGGDGQWGDGEAGGRRRRRRRGRGGEREHQDDVPFEGEPIEVEGLLDLREDGYGFLRVNGFLPSRDDVYVSVKQCRQLGLRRGDYLKGASRPAGRQEKNPALLRVDEVNGMEPDDARRRPRFEDLTPLYPDVRLRLESKDRPFDMTTRIIDLIAPIGKGQRGLIVSPPKAGKTSIMKTIAQAIERNNPEVQLMVLLVDERPEEVTDMRRSVEGEVIASTFDRPSDEHCAVAELAIERAKRLVEYGQDVVIILDGITRLARAYNMAAPATGRVMSGGIDTGALYPPTKFFGAARNVEEGGSLTILATALVETGSKMDEVIFEEFKGTGNMELRLDRRMAEKRIYPAIDVDGSSTRHEELLFDPKQLQQVWKLRRVLSGLAAEGRAGAGLELLMDRMNSITSNDAFLAEIAKAPSA